MNIFLRRFPGELITLIDASPPSGATCIAAVSAVDDEPRSTDDFDERAIPTRLYAVSLTGSASVTPVDWRRFACSDEDVRRLVGLCIRDNLRQFAYLPNTGPTLDAVRNCLGVALRDLQSIADVRSIDSRADGFRRWVEVRYEAKNGVLHALVVEQADM